MHKFDVIVRRKGHREYTLSLAGFYTQEHANQFKQELSLILDQMLDQSIIAEFRFSSIFYTDMVVDDIFESPQAAADKIAQIVLWSFSPPDPERHHEHSL